MLEALPALLPDSLLTPQLNMVDAAPPVGTRSGVCEVGDGEFGTGGWGWGQGGGGNHGYGYPGV